MDELRVRDVRQPGHFWADHEVIAVYGHKLGAYGVSVYMVLSLVARNGTGECRITMRQISRLINISPSRVMKSIQQLMELKLVAQEYKSNGQNDGPSVYTLLSVEKLSTEERSDFFSTLVTVLPKNGTVRQENGTVRQENTNKTDKTNKTDIQQGLLPGMDGTDVIKRVFDHFVKVTEKHPKLYTLTDTRMSMGRARFKDCMRVVNGDPARAEKMMLLVVDTLVESDFHMGIGEHLGKAKYNDWKHIFSSTDKLEQWIERSRQ